MHAIDDEPGALGHDRRRRAPQAANELAALRGPARPMHDSMRVARRDANQRLIVVREQQARRQPEVVAMMPPPRGEPLPRREQRVRSRASRQFVPGRSHRQEMRFIARFDPVEAHHPPRTGELVNSVTFFDGTLGSIFEQIRFRSRTVHGGRNDATVGMRFARRAEPSPVSEPQAQQGWSRHMRLGMLRPVGELVPLSVDTSTCFSWPAGYEACWVNSGTTALALAVRAVVARYGRGKPRVAIPGYSCPDLVAAILWAGARPIVVDTLSNSPWVDPAAVAALPQGDLAGVVSPHFLGIAPPLDALSRTCAQRGSVLIEDAAQSNVCSKDFSPSADLVILSFGRGKPIPVGGGVLLYRSHWSREVNAAASTLPLEPASTAQWRVRMMLQNLAMSRAGYALVRSLPGMAVGQTRFKPLQSPSRTPATIVARRESMLAQWHVMSGPVQQAIRLMLSRAASLQDITYELGWDGTAPLLRYPVLAANTEHRDHLVAALHQAGVEATAFYSSTVDKTRDTPRIDVAGTLASATRFAARLLTLPAHSSVTARDIATIGVVTSNAASSHGHPSPEAN